MFIAAQLIIANPGKFGVIVILSCLALKRFFFISSNVKSINICHLRPFLF